MITAPLRLSFGAALLFMTAACGGAAREAPPSSAGLVPDVIGLRLDEAEQDLGERGLEYYVYADDEVIIRSNWTVCSQDPEPGGRAAEVELYVEHFSCDGDD